MEKMGERIKRLRLSNGLTQEELGNRIGLKRAAINKYEKGNVENMKRSTIEKLSSLFNVTPSYLMALDDNTSDILPIYNKLKPDRQEKVYKYAKNELEDQEEETKVIGFPERKRIIRGRSTAAGTPIDGDVQDSEAETTVVDREEIPKNADEIITIAGDSMEPFLMKGEQAFIQYTPWVENGTAAVVSIEDVGVTCKYVYVEGQDIRLVSENNAYDDMIYPCEEVRIIGKIL
ncbi:XRE family transcriptional regulator [Latilactobacillus curvatus]|uniref:XRE family transcriptional regulator n=1 Tax=Latilactobacillus curvatus TaxID=28038 RepID=UPI0020735957|nr:XRE family transcriptional regulator [Latilactobacillus curvatus]MCM6843371.1 XRE family transcriptional regulator [Latilactobacillus curvatus]MCM6861777.1 XRE family transcriptional regulator [Latilactobacillus curvatus]MCM6869044.1 XRE family transcriptional regulator [Latilactobacillus curvatus]